MRSKGGGKAKPGLAQQSGVWAKQSYAERSKAKLCVMLAKQSKARQGIGQVQQSIVVCWQDTARLCEALLSIAQQGIGNAQQGLASCWPSKAMQSSGIV